MKSTSANLRSFCLIWAFILCTSLQEVCGFIDILKHEIKLPKDLINLFVFCIINIKLKQLEINIELDDGFLKAIKSVAFTIRNVIYIIEHN